jgi:hypothetical protein
MLRNDAPFGPLRVRSFEFYAEAIPDEPAVLALAADLASHAHLQRVDLGDAPLNTAAVLDAVVDAALARRLTIVMLDNCSLSPDSAPALVRLIGGGALAQLDIWGDDDAPLLDAPAALVLGNALSASSTLAAASLRRVNLWLYPVAAMALLGALTGHASLLSLNISNNEVNRAGRDQAGALIGALVAANAPALTALDVSHCGLRDAGLRLLFDALPANTHLRRLSCGDNGQSNAFTRNHMLPAVRANASLQFLDAGGWWNQSAAEVEALVRRRADAA